MDKEFINFFKDNIGKVCCYKTTEDRVRHVQIKDVIVNEDCVELVNHYDEVNLQIYKPFGFEISGNEINLDYSLNSVGYLTPIQKLKLINDNEKVKKELTQLHFTHNVLFFNRTVKLWIIPEYKSKSKQKL